MKKHKYLPGDTFNLQRDGESVVAKVIETDSGSEPYYVKIRTGKNKGYEVWIEEDDVEGGAWDETEDKFKVGDAVQISPNYDRQMGEVAGLMATVIATDENDWTLHYKVKIEESQLSTKQKDNIPAYYWDNEKFPTDGLWMREEHLLAVNITPELPSFNPGATVSDSLGMWRPPQVKS